ncbi:MAG: CPBP family intramembrane metalloprotease [Chloroflexi bacterium]|nr:MAG: CPBP family intramembrane metalloprotease [Chloroflexota bacterium]
MSIDLTSDQPARARSKSGLLRALEFPLARIAAGIVAAGALLVPAQLLAGGATSTTIRGALTEVYTGLAAGLALWLVARLIEKRRLAEVGLPFGRGTAFLPMGFGIGAAIAGASIGILAAIGSYSVVGNGDLSGSTGNLLLLLVFELGSAALQAILFYGIVFRVLAEWLGRWPAIALAVVLFGAIHLTGPDASAFSAVVVGLSGGVLLAVGYIATKGLWLPMGILWGINFAFAEILGAIPSAHHRLFEARLSGNELLSGGAAGAEAGGATLIVVAIAIALTLWSGSSRLRSEVVR